MMRPEAVLYAAQSLDYMDVHGGGTVIEVDIDNRIRLAAEFYKMDVEQFIIAAVIDRMLDES